ncbi:hypothetical protein CHCC16874_1335 [Bacillus licheniformis]|nr:hypothetical protein CHCC16874_1335 [Bacillus licheniformis]
MMNIYQKLVEVRKAVPYLKKSNQGHQYNYTGSSQVVGAIREKIDELGLLLIPAIVDKKVTAEKNGNRITYFTELDIEYTWVNAEKPDETIKTTFYAQGIDIGGEKGVGKALTYAEKYFLLKQFNVPTDQDDPDAFQQKVESSKPPEMITQEQKDEIQSLAQSYVDLRGEGSVKLVLTGLKIADFDKVPKSVAEQKIRKLKQWIAKAEKQSA